jgi:hypothetical protein
VSYYRSLCFEYQLWDRLSWGTRPTHSPPWEPEISHRLLAAQCRLKCVAFSLFTFWYGYVKFWGWLSSRLFRSKILKFYQTIRRKNPEDRDNFTITAVRTRNLTCPIFLVEVIQIFRRQILRNLCLSKCRRKRRHRLRDRSSVRAMSLAVANGSSSSTAYKQSVCNNYSISHSTQLTCCISLLHPAKLIMYSDHYVTLEWIFNCLRQLNTLWHRINRTQFN